MPENHEILNRRYSNNRWQIVLIAILILMLMFVGYYAYKGRVQSAALLTLTENNYQKDFHDLSQHINEITGQLAQVLSVASREQLALSLSSLWRQTFAAQANLGGLPLSMVQLNQTEKFLGDTADSVYYLLWRTSREADTLVAEEQDYVNELFQRSQKLNQALEEISYKIIKDDIKLVDLQNNLWEGDESKDNTVIDGLGMLETQLEDYPELNINSDLGQLAGREENTPGPPNELNDQKQTGDANVDQNDQIKNISLEKAINNAQDFWLGPDSTGFIGRIAYNSGGDLPTYGIGLYPANAQEAIAYVDVVKSDGKILWAMTVPKFNQADQEDDLDKLENSRDLAVFEPILSQPGDNLDINRGKQICLEFLSKRGFPDMTLTQSQIDGGFAIYTFVPMQEGVRLYPDQIKMQVELDNLQITGFEGSPYYRHHKPREIQPVNVTRNEIETIVSPHLDIKEINLAIIENDWSQEILTWEVRASISDEDFAIYYDVEHAVEEKILRLTPSKKYSFDF